MKVKNFMKKFAAFALGLGMTVGVSYGLGNRAHRVDASSATYTHAMSKKPDSGKNTLSNVDWNVTLTSNVGNFNSGNYQGVQIGTSSSTGEIVFETASDWGASGTYQGKTVVDEVYVWLNNGSGTISATVTVGGTSYTKSGTVVKNSSAKTYEDASKLTFKPSDNALTGKIKIDAKTSSKAGYFCAIEVVCSEPTGGTCTHDWGSGVVTTSATCTTAGVKTFTCSKCGETKTEEIAALGHNLENGVCTVCGTEVTLFEKYEDDLVEGDYVIRGGESDYYLKAEVSSNRFTNGTATVSENNIINPDVEIIWHIEQIEGTSYWTIYNESTKKYLGSTSSKNTGALLDEIGDYSKWTFDDGKFINYGRNKVASSDTNNCYLRNNTNSGWGAYSSTQGNAPVLYKKIVPACQHENLEENAENPATCTEAGDSAYWYCPDCTKWFSDADCNTEIEENSWVDAIEALGHDMQIVEATSPIDATHPGYRQHKKCSRCDRIEDMEGVERELSYFEIPYVAPHEHSYSDQFDGKDASGHWHICANDEDCFDITTNGYAEHTYGELLVVDIEATYFADGSGHYECSDCGYKSASVVIPQLSDHITEVTVSGSMTKKEYTVGDEWDVAGLSVYKFMASAPETPVKVTEGITWEHDPEKATEAGESITINSYATVEGVKSLTPATTTGVKVSLITNFEFTFDFSTYGWQNEDVKRNIVSDDGNVTITATNSGNNGKYYTSDSTWRMYKDGVVTISVPNNYKIKSITSNPSKTFTATDSNKNVFSWKATDTTKFKSIKVEYELQIPKTPSEIVLSGTYKTAFGIDETFNHDGMVVTVNYVEGGSNDVSSVAEFSSPNMSTIGTKTVTVSYTEKNTTVTETYDITVSKKLATPSNAQFDSENNQLTWDAVANAESYLVKIGENEYTANNNSLSLEGKVELGQQYHATITALTTAEFTINSDECVLDFETPDAPFEDGLYTIEIKATDFKTTSYASNDGVKVFTAKSSDTGKEMDVKFEIINVMQQSSKIQLKDNSSSIIASKRSLGDKINVSITGGTNISSTTTDGIVKIVRSGGTATATSITITFEIGQYKTYNWVNEGKTLKEVRQLASLEAPTFDGQEPTKDADTQYTYSFAGWNESTEGDVVTYTPKFNETLNKYTINFMNGDDILQSSEFEYGVTPVYNGAIPVKADDAHNSYVFAGWNETIIKVTGNATYTAKFNAVAKGSVEKLDPARFNDETYTVDVATENTSVKSTATVTGVDENGNVAAGAEVVVTLDNQYSRFVKAEMLLLNGTANKVEYYSPTAGEWIEYVPSKSSVKKLLRAAPSNSIPEDANAVRFTVGDADKVTGLALKTAPTAMNLHKEAYIEYDWNESGNNVEINNIKTGMFFEFSYEDNRLSQYLGTDYDVKFVYNYSDSEMLFEDLWGSDGMKTKAVSDDAMIKNDASLVIRFGTASAQDLAEKWARVYSVAIVVTDKSGNLVDYSDVISTSFNDVKEGLQALSMAHINDALKKLDLN